MAPLVASDKAMIPRVLADFPVSLSGKLCWDTDTFRNAKHRYIVYLNHGDIRSIEKAIASFKSMVIIPLISLG